MFDFIGRIRENPVYIKEKLLLRRRATVLFSIKITEDDKGKNTSKETETTDFPENKSSSLQQYLVKTLKKLPCEINKEGNTLKSIHKIYLPYWLSYTSVLFLFLLSILIAKYKYDYEFPPAFFLILSILQTIYFCLKAVNISAPLIIREKEQRTLESIITTPLTPQTILEGKFWAVFNHLTSELTAGLPFYVITGLFIEEFSFLRLIMIYFLTAGQIAFFTITALWCSGQAKNSKDAFVSANSLAGFIFLSPIIILIIMSKIHIYPGSYTIFLSLILPQFILLNPPVQSLLILLAPYFLYKIPENQLIYFYLSPALCFVTPVILWLNTLKHLRWTGKEETTGNSLINARKIYIAEINPPSSLPSFLPEKITTLINFIRNMNYNPVYIKDRIIQERVTGKIWFPFPSWTGYLTIALLPFLLTGFSWYNYRYLHSDTYYEAVDELYCSDLCNTYSDDTYDPLYSKYSWKLFYWYIGKKLKSLFIISCYLQIIYFYIRINSSSSCIFKREKELKTSESIISTPLLPADILRGKFWGAFYPPAYELTVIFPIFFITGLAGGINFLKLIAIYLLTLWHLAFITFIKLEWLSTELVKKDVCYIEYIARIFKNKTIMNLIINFYSNPPDVKKTENLTNYLVHWFLYILLFIFPLMPILIIFVTAASIAFANPFFYMTLILYFEKIFSPSSLDIYLITYLFISIFVYFMFTEQAWKYALKNIEHVPEE